MADIIRKYLLITANIGRTIMNVSQDQRSVPPTSSSIQLLARQRRGAAAAQNGNKTFDVVSQQDLEQIIF